MKTPEELNWVDEMIKRQMTPKPLRVGSVEKFCKEHNTNPSTYYYQLNRKENQKKIIKGCLMVAKEYTPEVLNKLAEKAKNGDMKAIDMFLNYVLELSTNLDLKSDGERIGIFDYATNKANRPNNRDPQIAENEQEG